MALWVHSCHLEGLSLQHGTREKGNECFPFVLATSGTREDLQALAADQEPKSPGFHEARQSPGTHSGGETGIIWKQLGTTQPRVPLFHPESLSSAPPSLFLHLLWADILQKASESRALSNETLSPTRQPVLIYGNDPSVVLFCVLLDRANGILYVPVGPVHCWPSLQATPGSSRLHSLLAPW